MGTSLQRSAFDLHRPAQQHLNFVRKMVEGEYLRKLILISKFLDEGLIGEIYQFQGPVHKGQSNELNEFLEAVRNGD